MSSNLPEEVRSLQARLQAAEEELARLRAEVEAKQSESRDWLLSLLGMLPGYVCLLSPEHDFRFVNQGFVDTFGDPGGRKCYEALFDREEPCEDCETLICLQSKAPHVWEWSSPSGHIYEVYDCPFTDSDGTTVVLEVGFDITERKREARELAMHRADLEALVHERTMDLAERSRILEAVFQHTLECVALLDRNFNFVRVNEAYAAADQRSADFYPGRNHFDLFPSPLKDIFEQVVRTKQPYIAHAREFEYADNPERGVTYWDWTLVPILDSDCEVEYLLLSLQDVTANERSKQQLLTHQDRLRSLAAEVSLAEERERRRLATGLHDDVCQNLAFAKMALRGLESSCASPEAARAYGNVFDMLTQSIQTTRSLTFELSPPALYQFGFEAALRQLAEQAAQRHGFEVRIEAAEESAALSHDVQVTLFQAMREVLANVAKHAQASTVRIALQRRNGELWVQVRDDGVGFDSQRLQEPGGGGYGLFNISERLAHLGGGFEVESEPGRGTVTTLRVPVEEAGG